MTYRKDWIMGNAVLIINSGSSSVKFAFFATRNDAATLRLVYRGIVANIGANATLHVNDAAGRAVEPGGERHPVPAGNHQQALATLFAWMDEHATALPLIAAGHRVVHGADKYAAPVLISEAVLDDLRSYIPLAPLHQPHNVAGIEAVKAARPGLPQVACFDTAFHLTQPTAARTFALPRELTDAGVKRYGFHGLSYEYIASVLPEFLAGKADGRVVVAHLGNGASMCGLLRRKSVVTTMGFTPLDGLPMGTRCGALDPGVILYLLAERGMDAADVTDLLYHKSGLLGVSGISGNMRELLASDSPRAREAVELFVYRIGRELGSLAAAIDGLDALVFTGGIGEHAAPVRARVCRHAGWLGLTLDEAANLRGDMRISAPDSRASAWVIPTNEELIIARHTLAAVGPTTGQAPLAL